MDFPIENGDFFHSYVSHYQRVPVFSYNGLSPTSHGQSPEQNAVELQRGTAQWLRHAQLGGQAGAMAATFAKGCQVSGCFA